jgi:hypothetical protein
MSWTKEEIKYLKKNYSTNSNMKEIAKKLNKSIRSIQHKGVRLGLKRPRFKKEKSEAQPKKEIDKRYYEKHKKEIYLRKKERVRNLREGMKMKMGGECKKCGYNKCMAALDFHHIREKEDKMSSLFKNQSKKKALKEIEKCILLCANCHREVHFKG